MILSRLEIKLKKMNDVLAKEKERQKSIVEIFDKKKIIVLDLDCEDPSVK